MFSYVTYSEITNKIAQNLLDLVVIYSILRVLLAE